MARVEEALRTRILACSPVELLGGMPKGRVYALVLPQGDQLTLPAVAWRRISTSRDRTSDGPSRLVFARVQYECWGKTLAEAESAADAVRLALDGYNGQVDGVDLQTVDVDEDRQDYDDAVKLFCVSMDALVWFSNGEP
jgi:hypothetical protein